MKSKKIMILLITLTLIVTNATSPIVKAEASIMTKSNEVRTDLVSVFIELEEEPISNCSNRELGLEKVRRQQKSVQNEINGVLGKETVQFEKEYQYLFNGFMAKINASDMESIKKIDQVKDVYAVPQFKADVRQESDRQKKFKIAKSFSIKKEYTGRGTAVAVLDTGFDVDHEAFKAGCNDAKIDEEKIDGLIDKDRLNIDKGNKEGIYKNSKFPFIYDYSDNDTDVSSREYGLWDHGTHVAGIVGASSGEIDGVVPDTQIVAMKVFRDDGSVTSFDVILAALEDAVELNVDAINMSFGEAYGFSTDAMQSVRNVFRRIEDKGICMSVAAGNNVNTSINSGLQHMVLASNPDISSIASPASDLSTVAVGGIGDEGVLDISSWGTTPDLKLKPDISAYGEMVKSCLPDNQYGELRGTSMSAPCFTGNYLALKEKLNEEYKDSAISDKEKCELCIDRLMSTAKPVKDKDGVYESPRKQGSGNVDGKEALNAKAYLYTDTNSGSNGRPIINLYDDVKKRGEYEFTFYIKSQSDKPMDYRLNFASMVAKTDQDEYGSKFLDDTFKDCTEDYSVTYFANGTKVKDSIQIAPSSVTEVKVKILMDKKLKRYYNKTFANGQFVEGYIFLENSESGQQAMSIPFMGFYGDWTRAAIFDSGSIYDWKPYSQTYHALYTDNGNTPLGLNPFDVTAMEYRDKERNPYYWSYEYKEETLLPDKNKIAISPNGDGKYDSLDLIRVSLLRNVANLSCEIKDSHGKIIMQGECEQVRKTYYDYFTMSYCATTIEPEFQGITEDGERLKNNQVVKVYIKGKLDYPNHKMSNINSTLVFPVTIDVERPYIGSYKIVHKAEKTFLITKVKDNQFVSAVEIGNYDSKGNFNVVDNKLVNEKKRGKETVIKFDITELVKKGGKADLMIRAYDYAMNDRQKHIVAKIK